MREGRTYMRVRSEFVAGGTLAALWRNGSLRTHSIALLLPLALNVWGRPDHAGFISKPRAMQLSGLSARVFDNTLDRLGEQHIELRHPFASEQFIHYRLCSGLLAERHDQYFVITDRLFAGAWQQLAAAEQSTLVTLAATATTEVWGLEDFFDVEASDLESAGFAIVQPAIGPDMARRVGKLSVRGIARLTGMDASSVSRALSRVESSTPELLVTCQSHSGWYYQMPDYFWAGCPDTHYV